MSINVKIYKNACEKCSGDMFIREDIYFSYFICFQCGKCIEIGTGGEKWEPITRGKVQHTKY